MPTAATRTATLSLHDALPICGGPTGTRPLASAPGGPARSRGRVNPGGDPRVAGPARVAAPSSAQRLKGDACTRRASRSEEHTSELQSRFDLVCRLLLEKKNKK